MLDRITRRRFMQTAAAAASTTLAAPAILRGQNLNSKLNIACVGVSGKGSSDSDACKSENIVALCDVDSDKLEGKAKGLGSAKKFNDFRKMLEQVKEIDAVTVSTPDHMHAPVAMMAMKLGKHVFVQKPLAHTVAEARLMAETARKYKVHTQMGNQGHCGDGYRMVCEWIWQGALGEVREVHSWTNRPIWPQGGDRPAGQDPVPANLNWDAWLGPAAMRPFKSKWPEDHPNKRFKGKAVYHPFSWRGWWDFGCGALGDMACHIMDGAVWALKLGYPKSVEVVEASGTTSEMAPNSSVLKFEFPARGEMPPVTYYWHDGGKLPPRPADLEEGRKLAEGDNGTLFIGSKAKLMCGTYGGSPRIFPEKKMQEIGKPKEMIPRVKGGPIPDWVRAIKQGGEPPCANFDYAGPFTEIILLGNLALRLGKKIEWDGPNMKATNAPEAQALIHKQYRKGWEL